MTLFRILLLPALALLFLAGTAQAYQARTFDRNADAVIKHLMTLPVFEGARIREAQVPWDATTRRVQIGPENGETVGAVLFSRDGALAGLQMRVVPSRGTSNHHFRSDHRKRVGGPGHRNGERAKKVRRRRVRPARPHRPETAGVPTVPPRSGTPWQVTLG